MRDFDHPVESAHPYVARAAGLMIRMVVKNQYPAHVVAKTVDLLRSALALLERGGDGGCVKS